MASGVPISAAVSGIAMGVLMDDQGNYTILSDIQGLEDHYGDMDFKVAGTPKGITALQLDIKVSGLSEEILTKALQQAKEGRLHILDTMLAVIEKPRETLNPNAPKIEYKDVKTLTRYISERGKIVPSRITAVSSKKQRELAKAIKRARFLALLPYGSH